MPYDPTTRTTARTTTEPPTSPPNNADWMDEDRKYLIQMEHLEYDLEYYERMRSAAEDEFIQNGPTHLLEAVYCDPCKSKVMDMCQKYIHA